MRAPLSIPFGPAASALYLGRGILADAGTLIRKHGAPIAAAVVSDETVGALYMKPVLGALTAAGIDARPVVVAAGEGAKSFGSLERLCGRLLDLDLGRDDCVVALGGGVVGDLAGLAASLVKRGLGLVQIPTTLVAQADAAIGGKTAINTRHGKNLIGSFYPAGLIIADVAALETLPEREFRAGWAEVVKHAVIAGDKEFTRLEAARPAFFSHDPEALLEIVGQSQRIKAAIVAEDGRDEGRRLVLNLGHSFGHALETSSGGRLLHGEAVAIGIALAFAFASWTGGGGQRDQARVTALLEKAGLATTLRDAGMDTLKHDLAKFMARDKKRNRGGLRLVVAHALGDVRVADGVTAKTLDGFLSTV